MARTGSEAARPYRWARTRRWAIWLLALFVVLGSARASLANVYRAVGGSMAPTIQWGDTVLLNRAAYGLRLPFGGTRVLEWSEPEPGDVVLVRASGPEGEFVAFKRIVAVGGDVVELRAGRLVLNGWPAVYRPEGEGRATAASPRNKIGSVVELEVTGQGPAHAITYTPRLCELSTFGPVDVPDGHYFVLGDNRDNSRDSRDFGPVRRDQLLGRAVRVLTSPGG